MQTKLVGKLGQRLAMTPQLSLSLKILAMNSTELDAHVKQCLENNPLIEVDRPVDGVEAEPVPEAGATETWQESGDNRWEMMYAAAGDQDNSQRERQWQQEKSLSESLHEQIDCQPMSEEQRTIAHALIGYLEDDGYFLSDAVVLADEMQATPEALVDVLENIVQQLEPAGIGARDLMECLQLQLDTSNETDVLVSHLLSHCSEQLFEADEKLAGIAGCSTEELEKARARMRRLDPFPGHGLYGQTNIYVRPEMIFRRIASGQFEIEVPSYGWHGIRINNPWKDHSWQGKDRAFMDNASKEAKWLLYSLDQRRATLHKVAECLADRQRDFLEHGLLGLKPLTLQDVADEVGLHESTISRVTNGKYAETPLGLIELRRFFSAGLPTRNGKSISVYRVQQRVRSLIEAEPAGKPISDQAISDRLHAEGIEIARRTTAKYREQLGIPTSSQRRKTAPQPSLRR